MLLPGEIASADLSAVMIPQPSSSEDSIRGKTMSINVIFSIIVQAIRVNPVKESQDNFPMNYLFRKKKMTYLCFSLLFLITCLKAPPHLMFANTHSFKNSLSSVSETGLSGQVLLKS